MTTLAAWSSASRAQPVAVSSCEIATVPSSLPRAWRVAADALARDPAFGGCARLSLHSTTDGVLVVFETNDGRAAVRAVRRPDELVPTVEALRASIELAAATAPFASTSTSTSASTGSAPSTATSATTSVAPAVCPSIAPAPGISAVPSASSTASAPPVPRAPWLYLGTNGGLRFANGGRWTTPTLGVSARAELPYGFEIGVEWQWETSYWVEQAIQGYEMDGWVASLAFGKLFTVFDALAVSTEATVGVAEIDADEERVDDTSIVGLTRTELRLGARAAVVFPRTGVVRLRPYASLDWAPLPTSQRGLIPSLLPVPPEFFVSFGVGFEVGL